MGRTHGRLPRSWQCIFTRGHDAWRAVHYCYLAGENAWWRSAYQEMISHCTTAVELLETLPDTVERAQRETVLQLTLGRVWGMTKGWGAPAVGQAYARARLRQKFPMIGWAQRLVEAPLRYVAEWRQRRMTS